MTKTHLGILYVRKRTFSVFLVKKRLVLHCPPSCCSDRLLLLLNGMLLLIYVLLLRPLPHCFMYNFLIIFCMLLLLILMNLLYFYCRVYVTRFVDMLSNVLNTLYLINEIINFELLKYIMNDSYVSELYLLCSFVLVYNIMICLIVLCYNQFQRFNIFVIHTFIDNGKNIYNVMNVLCTVYYLNFVLAILVQWYNYVCILFYYVNVVLKDAELSVIPMCSTLFFVNRLLIGDNYIPRLLNLLHIFYNSVMCVTAVHYLNLLMTYGCCTEFGYYQCYGTSIHTTKHTIIILCNNIYTIIFFYNINVSYQNLLIIMVILYIITIYLLLDFKYYLHLSTTYLSSHQK